MLHRARHHRLPQHRARPGPKSVASPPLDAAAKPCWRRSRKLRHCCGFCARARAINERKRWAAAARSHRRRRRPPEAMRPKARAWLSARRQSLSEVRKVGAPAGARPRFAVT